MNAPDPEIAASLPDAAEDAAAMPPVPEPEILEPLPEPLFAGASETGLMRADGPATLPVAAAEPPPEPADVPDGPCRCGTCDAPPEPGKDALLYYGPGIATRTWETRIRNGQWEDITAEFNAAHARVHLPALKRNGQIRLDLSTGARNLAAVFDARPDALDDEGLTGKLAHAVAMAEAELTMQQTYMHWETMQRIAALRDDLTEDGTEAEAA